MSAEISAAARAQQRRVLAATSVSYVVVILDTSIVNVALQRIGQSLATDIAGLQWVVNAYALAFASLLLTGGTLGDRWGPRRVYLGGLVVFTAASGLCGLAPNLAILTVARIVQGVGAALLVPCSLTLLNRAFPNPAQRAGAIGVWAGWGGAALAAGPLLGGLLINLSSWRAIFLVNLPIGVLGLLLTQRIAPDRISSQTRHLDLAGQCAAIVGLAALVGTLIELPTRGWNSAPILSGVALGVVAWVAFLTIEARRSQPMLPLSLFANRRFAASTVVAMATTLILFGLIFVLSLYFQQVRRESPMQTGFAFLPLTAVVTGGNMVSGRWVKAAGPRNPVLAGLVAGVMGTCGLLAASPSSPYWQLGLPMLFLGMAGGLITPAVTAALMAEVESARAGIAAGILNTARQLGSALGVAIFGAMLAVFPAFQDGMRASCATAAVVTVLCAVLWWGAPVAHMR